MCSGISTLFINLKAIDIPGKISVLYQYHKLRVEQKKKNTLNFFIKQGYT